MKIGVISDLRANLPALKAVLVALEAEDVDAIFHLGDAIAIGPHPGECIELLLATPNLHLVRGNHESYYLEGIPKPQPTWMSEGEVRHQAWVRKQLGSKLQQKLRSWPWMIDRTFAGVNVRFQHYALATSGKNFAPILRKPSAEVLEAHLSSADARIVFYGHTHRFADQSARIRMINPGSLGCQREAQAPYTVVEFHDGLFSVEHFVVPYDDGLLWKDFEERQVPERYLLYSAFFGGRFPW
jgi:predicted phosphodiesterase